MDIQLAGAQGGGGFEPDEARTDDHDAARAFCGGDDRTAILQRAQDVDMGKVGSRDGEPNRLGSGREQQ